jgi:hypothetical protein
MRVSGCCMLVGALALAVAAPASAESSAQDKGNTAIPAPVPSSPQAAAHAKGPPDFGALLGIVDKLFPPQPDPDPTRLALARTSVRAMWPNGAYGKMMTGFMGGMFDKMMQLKKSDFAALDDKKVKPTAATTKDMTVHEEATAKDPYFDQRMAAMRDVVSEELGKISVIIDPRMREGLARSMARRFDAQQLGDINRFFATPSGQAFAGQYMQLWIDPDTIRSIFASMPEMMKLMPEMMQKFKAANDKFPSPKKTPAVAPKAEGKP